MFGDVDIGGAASSIQASSAMSQMPTATFSLNPTRAAFFDYSAPLLISMIEGGSEKIIFGGEANAATFNASSNVVVDARGGNGFRDLLSPIMSHWGPAELDVMYMLARESGLTKDSMRIQGLQSTPDVFEIAVPLSGANVDGPLMVGSVWLLPSTKFSHVDPSGDLPVSLDRLVNRFKEAHVVAVTYVADKALMFDAESEGVDRIRSAIAWLRVKAANGASVWPGHLPREFLRAELRSSISLEDGVLVKGLTSGRAWLRTLALKYGSSLNRLDRRSGGEHLQPPSRFGDAQAVLACARAAEQGTDLMIRVNALWEALEFLASSISAPEIISKAERRRLRRSLGEGLTDRQKERVDFVLGTVNQAPLMWKVRRLAETHGVPISEGEFALLQSLRSLRNDAVHGRRVVLPTVAEMGHAVSVVARILMYVVSAEKD